MLSVALLIIVFKSQMATVKNLIRIPHEPEELHAFFNNLYANIFA